jgi:ribosomal protein S18 acetylase RimI-like enzyme
MNFIIRNCKTEDLGKLVELCEKHALYEKAEYNSENKSEQLEKAVFSDNPKLYCKIVEIQNQIIGYFSYTFDFSTWDAQIFLHLDCIYIEEKFRSIGIGKKIIEDLKIISKENQCVNIQWQTPIFNEKAIKFYKRNGAIGKDKIRFFLNE